MSTRKICASLAASVLMAFSSAAAMSQAKIKLEKVVWGINAPLAMVQLPGETRMLIVEQNGRIQVLENGQLGPSPFLDVRSKIVKLHHDFDERGLLGVALHPKFKENGKVYVAYSAHLDYGSDLGQMLWYDHSNVVEEYTISSKDKNMPDPSSARRILSTSWPQFNHNGHWIGFGPDGKLYVSLGDGGYANDWGIGHNVTIGNGQDMTTMLGKIIRIDVDTRTEASPTAFRPTTPSSARRTCCPKSGRLAFATRGVVRSTPAAANCSAATCSKTATKPSRLSARARTWAGAGLKA